jgi:hypothetical protein
MFTLRGRLFRLSIEALWRLWAIEALLRPYYGSIKALQLENEVPRPCWCGYSSAHIKALLRLY